MRKPHAATYVEIADLIAPALEKPTGRLEESLRDLWTRLKDTPKPDAALFALRRYSSQERIAEFWWLQLLVMLTCACATRIKNIIQSGLGKLVRNPAAAQLEAQTRWRAYCRSMGGDCVAAQTIDALVLFNDVLPRGIEIVNARILINGSPLWFKPSRLDLVFMDQLIAGKATRANLKHAGVPSPPQTKRRLANKDTSGTLKLIIRGDQSGGYRLED